MRKHLALFLAALVLASSVAAKPVDQPRLYAQITAHSVALAWVLSIDDTTTMCTTGSGCLQTLYRGNGACGASTVFAPLSAGLTATAVAFTDTAPIIGNSCYGLTFTINGAESPKALVSVLLLPASQTSFTGVGK